jgi:hypothetical protein
VVVDTLVFPLDSMQEEEVVVADMELHKLLVFHHNFLLVVIKLACQMALHILIQEVVKDKVVEDMALDKVVEDRAFDKEVEDRALEEVEPDIPLEEVDIPLVVLDIQVWEHTNQLMIQMVLVMLMNVLCKSFPQMLSNNHQATYLKAKLAYLHQNMLVEAKSVLDIQSSL